MGKILSYRQLRTVKNIPYCRVHLRLIMQGLFPAAIRLSPNRVGWHEDAIDEWLKSRPTVQYGSSGKAGADEAV